MYSPALAMLFGLINTMLIHLAKAMERHGIEIFDQIRARVSKQDSETSDAIDIELREKDIDVTDVKKPTIYIIGFALNQTPALWAMFSNMFSQGNSNYYSSMGGVGLIVLLIYSAKILNEPVRKPEIIGAIILITGTLIIGIENIFRPEPSTEIQLTSLWIFLGLYVAIGVMLMVFAIKKNDPLSLGIIFGGFAGGCGAMDPFFKSVSQLWGVEEAGFLPDITNPFAVIIFILSFGVGTASFLITQWGFARDADASVLVPTHTTASILVPVIVYLISYPGQYTIYWTTILGFALIVIGIVLMQGFKEKDKFENIEVENPLDYVEIDEKKEQELENS